MSCKEIIDPRDILEHGMFDRVSQNDFSLIQSFLAFRSPPSVGNKTQLAFISLGKIAPCLLKPLFSVISSVLMAIDLYFPSHALFNVKTPFTSFVFFKNTKQFGRCGRRGRDSSSVLTNFDSRSNLGSELFLTGKNHNFLVLSMRSLLIIDGV